MNRKMHDLALVGRCGGFGSNGLARQLFRAFAREPKNPSPSSNDVERQSGEARAQSPRGTGGAGGGCGRRGSWRTNPYIYHLVHVEQSAAESYSGPRDPVLVFFLQWRAAC